FCKSGFTTANMSGFNSIVGLLFVVNWGHGWGQFVVGNRPVVGSDQFGGRRWSF
ncbi:Hypothetical predicted protein, partial [Olea europaea subsp. europaea]